MKYYHITHPKNARGILKNGIISNSNGDIFLFENKSIVINGIENTIADSIAFNQLFLKEYSMFEIDISGISSDLVRDNVAEFTSESQWVVENQKVILPKHIDFFGTFKTSYISFHAKFWNTY
jgi:hypothetical protein